MTERNEIPSEAALCNWASDGSTYSSADPGAPKRLTGFQPKDEPTPGPGEVIPAEDHNFLWRVGMEMISWLRDGATRQWQALSEAITEKGGSPFSVIRVVPPLGSPPIMYARLVQLYNVVGTATSGGAVLQLITDGEQLYYQNNAEIVAADPLTGAEVWEVSPGTSIDSIASDGANVYYTGDVAQPGLRKISRVTGAPVASGGAEYACSRLVSNGVFAVGINGNVGGANSMVFWTVATPTETGTVTPGGAITALAIDADQAYVGGTRNAGNDVFARTLATRASAWAVPLDTNDPSPVNAIAADGDFVYVGCDSFAIAAGGNRSLFCLERVSGAVLWSMDLVNIDVLAVDDRYLYAVNSAGLLYMIRLRGAVPSVVATLADVNSVACDGVSVVCGDFTTPVNFQRNMAGGASKEFMIAHGNDPNRRPFFNLAVPVDGRI